MALHEWVFATPTGRRMIGQDGGTPGIDEDYLAQGETGIGATIMGRNMFGPIRGPWVNPKTPEQPLWQGWWGESPPYHHPVFVMTHHARPPLEMKDGTVFHFVTEGAESALKEARAAAGELDIRLGGGAATIGQFLRAGLVDYLHLAMVPVLLGRGERLFTDGVAAAYTCTTMVASAHVTHLEFARADGSTQL